jgi:uncharacterized protein (PEP-CTERM system associated)
MRWGCSLPLRGVVCAALLASAAGASAQQRAWLVPSLSAQINWSDNVGLEPKTEADDDVVTELSASLALRLASRRYSLTGEFGATAVNYLQETQRDRVLPRVRLAGSVQPIERLLYIDAGVATAELVENPFAATAEGASTVNRFTTTTYSVSPYLDWRLSPRTQLLVRSAHSRTETRGSEQPLQDGSFARQSLRFNVLPQPLGLTLEAERSESRTRGEVLDTLDQTLARLVLSYAPADVLTLNLRAGFEDNEFSGVAVDRESIYGAGFEWRPTERTSVRALGEHRFFGTGGEAAFTHRMPWLAWNLRVSRELSTSQEALLAVTGTGNLADLLDAILTTRYPDAQERARVVQDLIRRQGLPSTVAAPFTIYSQQAFVTTGRELTVGFLGINNTLSFSAAFSRVVGALPTIIVLTGSTLTESEQLSAGVSYSRRLSPFSALNLTWGRSYIRSLSETVAEETRRRTFRVGLTRRLSPLSELAVGARRQETRARDLEEIIDNGVFVGLSKRFN